MFFTAMTFDPFAKYVAAAYAIILVVLFTYYVVAARRLTGLQRQVDLLSEAVDKQTGRSGNDV